MTIDDAAPVLWLHDIAGERVGALRTVFDLEIDERLQSTETIKFTVDATDPKAAFVDVDRIVEIDGEQYRIKEIVVSRDGARSLVQATAEALWCDLLDSLFLIQEPATVTGTIADGLDFILDLNGWLGDWTAGTVEADGGPWALEFTETVSTLAAIRQWAGLVGREVVFDTVARTVSLVVSQGDDTARTFRYGRDVTKVARTVEPPEATRLYAYGKDWLSFASVNDGDPFVEDLTYYTAQGLTEEEAVAAGRHQLWNATEYTNAVQLYDAAVARLATLSQPRVSYSLDVTDLAELTGNVAPVQLGDRVRVVDLDLGVNVETRVVRLVRRPFDPSADTVELSFLQSGLSDSSPSGGSGGGSAFSVFSSVNVDAFTIMSTIYTPNTIALTLSSVTDLVTGVEVAGTATGSGTVTAQLYWGTEPVGVEVRQAFVAGAFQLGIPQVLQGIDGSRNLNLRLRVTSGSGTVAVAAGASTLYAIASNAAGGASGDPSIDLNDPVDTTPVTVSETVTLTNPP